MFPSIGQALGVVAPLVLAAASQTTSLDYCAALAEVISICEESTTNFLQLSATAQASCYCGTSLGTLPWGPVTFDGLASECASQYATLDVTVASDAALLAGFCTEFAGGVQSGPATQTSHSVVNTASASVLKSLTSGPSSTGTNHSRTATTLAATTAVSVVTVAATASSTSSNNVGHKNEPQGLMDVIHALITPMLVLVAFF